MSGSSSNSEQDQIRSMAGRIARRVARHAAEGTSDEMESSDEVASLRASLREMQQRLSHIEARITHDESAGTYKSEDASFQQRKIAPPENKATQASVSQTPVTRSPWLSGVYVPAAHPSAERFGVDEAAAVSELVDFFEGAKICELEPGGKPCDHCAMCSSRGF
ncbi:MAG: hypothetical protein ABR577_08195 [Pyrinomonadaceae bacterium]